MTERVVLVCDVCGNPAQESVTFKIGDRNWAKDLCQTHVAELMRNARAPRHGRRPNTAFLLAAAPRRRGPAAAPAATAEAGASKASPAAKRPRKRITDPAILQKRRAALEKARKALAEKRASAKNSG